MGMSEWEGGLGGGACVHACMLCVCDGFGWLVAGHWRSHFGVGIRGFLGAVRVFDIRVMEGLGDAAVFFGFLTVLGRGWG